MTAIATPIAAPDPDDRNTGNHYLDLDGSAVLETEDLIVSDHKIEEALATEAIGLFWGPAGLGKTFAVTDALANRGVDAHWCTFVARPSARQIAHSVLEQITGHNHGGNRYQLLDSLVTILEQPTVLVVDEAQTLNAEGTHTLRWLHDQRTTRLTLLLVGGNGAHQVITSDPMLDSRVHVRHGFRPQTPDEVAAAIPDYHPIYQHATEELIRRIDEDSAHGNLRRWARFTKIAARRCEAFGAATITDAIADWTLAIIGDDHDDA